MKKIILVALMVLASLSVYAQSSVWVEGGYLPQTAKVEYPEGAYSELFLNNVFYVDLGINYTWRIFYFGGAVKTWMIPKSEEVNFLPFYTFYRFDAGVKIDGLTIGYEHGCAHSVGALGYLIDPLFPVDSGFDKLFIRMEVKF